MLVEENCVVGIAKLPEAEQVVFEVWHDVAGPSMYGGYAGECQLSGRNGRAAFPGGRLDGRGGCMRIFVEKGCGGHKVMVRRSGVRNGC